MIYTIYSLELGRIERVVSCEPDMLSLQFDAGLQGAIDGSFDDAAFYVVDGRPVAMPPKPSQHHVFDYISKQWVDPRTPETEWQLVRADRNRRLAGSDWTQLPDVPLAAKETWAAYRQALRDVTEQPDPFSIVWPSPPA